MSNFNSKNLIFAYSLFCLGINSVYAQKSFSITETLKNNEFKYSKEALTSTFANWGINPENSGNIKLLGAWKNFKKKKDIVVAIVDTGIDPEHFYLAENIYINGEKGNSSNYGMDFSKNRQNVHTPIDTNGHGSHISGIIKSIFPDVKLLPLKYYNETASGNENLASTIEALKYAVEQKVDIINYSGGGDGASLQEYNVLKEAEKKGILVVVAAGNKKENIDNPKNAFYPASYGLSNIIVTTAHNEQLNILESSNFGATVVDISAPGYKIKSSLSNGRFGNLTGTSQATAFVSGVAALIKANYPELSPNKIREIIRNSASKEVNMAGKCVSGGRLNAESALELALSYTLKTHPIPSTRQIANQ